MKVSGFVCITCSLLSDWLRKLSFSPWKNRRLLAKLCHPLKACSMPIPTQRDRAATTIAVLVKWASAENVTPLRVCPPAAGFADPRVVGRTAIAVAVFSLLPFVILVLWGLPDCTIPGSWLSPPDGGWGAIRWGAYLNVMFW